MINRTHSILRHMLRDAMDIQELVKEAGDCDTFAASMMYRKAIIFSILNIGELAKNLPQEFKTTHNEIKWKSLADMRDIAAHRYHAISDEVIWDTATNSIPELAEFLQKQLRS